MTSTPFVQVEDLAKHFVVSLSTIRKWLHSGAIPKDTYIKIGSTYRFDLPKVVAALTAAPKDPEQLEFDFGNQEDN